MKIPFYHVDSFTTERFRGNPAGVCILDEWLPDEVLQNIAFENCLAETAFVRTSQRGYEIRWFTPDIEMDLCGHATLASAFVIGTLIGIDSKQLVFSSKSGPLPIQFLDDLIVMEFPSRVPVVAELPSVISQALSLQPMEVLRSRDYILVFKSQEEIESLTINRVVFDQINLDPGGVVVTAAGKSHDFVSRYFTPQSTILEDPVTGSSHCSLIPYWSNRLNKDELLAKQVSRRSGELICRNNGDRVHISGRAVVYLEGKIII